MADQGLLTTTPSRCYNWDSLKRNTSQTDEEEPSGTIKKKICELGKSLRLSVDYNATLAFVYVLNMNTIMHIIYVNGG